MNKHEIRINAKEKRDALPDRGILSRKIGENLRKVAEFQKARTVMFYVSFQSEVDTRELIHEIILEKKVVVPVVKGKLLEVSTITRYDELKGGNFGILEPKNLHPVLLSEIDCVLVPGIAFDKRGYRIGFGKGYYDRLLKKISCLKIGLAFEVQIIEKVPEEPNDVPVDLIVTEKRIIECKNKQ